MSDYAAGATQRPGIDLDPDALVLVPDLEVVRSLRSGFHETGTRLLGFGEGVEPAQEVPRRALEQCVLVLTHARHIEPRHA